MVIAEQAELNIRLAQPLVAYVKERHGIEAVRQIALSAGIDADQLVDGSDWVAHAKLELVLATARGFLGSDQEFMDACAHNMRQANGPMRFLVGAIGPRDAYELGARFMRVVSTVSRFEPRVEANGAVIVRYVSEKSESKLMCLSRQGQMVHLPEMWNMPRAHLVEKSCIAHGDDACEYVLNLYEPNRWLPIAVGLAAGVGAAFGLGQLELGSHLTMLAFGLIGGGAGHLLELRRTNRLNSAAGREINSAYLSVSRDEARARHEILELSQRQHAWIGRLEERAGERSEALEQLMRGMDDMRDNWVTSIRGFSHDLRSPLMSLKNNVLFLKESSERAGPDSDAALGDIDDAVQRMEKLLVELLGVATSGTGSVRLEPEVVPVVSLVDRIRSRTSALVQGRGIRVSVLPTREAPESIEVDPLLLDRVLDNLLSNAAKYTERGSIVVELDGTPGYLTIKVSDTGRGIAEADIEKIFAPRGSLRKEARADSWGLGLSVVVQLLSRIGGKIEVMSKPGQGTTFWVHFPVKQAATHPPLPVSAKRDPESEVTKVVSIRRLKSA
jgi:signal transduction histidine kinase